MIAELLQDKGLKPKEKTETICRWLLDGSLTPQQLMNADHEGTVVRWSAATALSAILLLKTGHNEILVPAVEALLDREGKDSIRKIYSAALKKLC
jgi:hypothetical protein